MVQAANVFRPNLGFLRRLDDLESFVPKMEHDFTRNVFRRTSIGISGTIRRVRPVITVNHLARLPLQRFQVALLPN